MKLALAVPKSIYVRRTPACLRTMSRPVSTLHGVVFEILYLSATCRRDQSDLLACERREHFSRRPLPRIPRSMRGREKPRRGRLSRKEQAPIDRRSQHRAVSRVSRQRV